ncbi:metalloregulator ArsR/SmtB family transcription factor [Nocardioides sp. KR10-350]|uniref:ArsR/SmtB family transcription factor n=1 Tax=Nocardioides cheoyonin TaxID=3156615 RepID=UPI0032B4D2FD
MPEKLPRRRLTDPRELRALAHPLRLRLMEELAFGGPLTASELAERVGESPANCSWHLRQLAKYGFVEEAEGRAGRRRPWRLVLQSSTWGDADDRELQAAGQAVGEMLVEHEYAERRAFLAREAGEPRRWRDAAFLTQSLAWMTPAELHEVDTVLTEIVTRHPERFTDPSTRPRGARPVRVLGWGFPARAAEEQG